MELTAVDTYKLLSFMFKQLPSSILDVVDQVSGDMIKYGERLEIVDGQGTPRKKTLLNVFVESP